MRGKPPIAHNTQTRWGVAFVSPRPFRDGGHDAEAEDDPHDAHRHAMPWMLFITCESNGSAATDVCQTAHPHFVVPDNLELCRNVTAIEPGFTSLEHANSTIVSAFKR